MEATETVKQLRGSMTALVTPFRSGTVDRSSLDALVDRQIAAGADWLVALGTTAEVPTLARAEREQVLDAVLTRAANRCPVMAGTGTNDTAETVNRTRQAASAGADAVLVVAPYYNRPTAEGLFRHFASVAESVDLPIVLYDVPVRTGVTIGHDVITRLRKNFPQIKAVKDATGRVENVTELRSRCDVEVLSGDDSLTWPLMALGAVGVISVVGNLCPSLMKSLVTAALRGDVSAARACHQKVYDLAEGIGRYGPNPLPIKTAMAFAGLLVEEFRLPLCPLPEEARAGIKAVLHRHEIVTQVPG